jgi:hypothetical protein
MGIVNGPIVPRDGVVGTQTGCASVLAIDKIESENSINNLRAFIFIIFLISGKKFDVLMSGCFRYI